MFKEEGKLEKNIIELYVEELMEGEENEQEDIKMGQI